MNTTKNKYLKYTCPKCKNQWALEQTETHKACRKIIGKLPNGKPIYCNHPFPNQQTRNILEKQQYHAIEESQ